MNSRKIKAELILKGIFFSDIAEEAGCSVAQVSMCISGKGLYLHVREIIAKHLGKQVHEIFNSNHPVPKHKTQTVKAA